MTNEAGSEETESGMSFAANWAAVGPVRPRLGTRRWTVKVTGLIAVVGLVVAACGGGENHTNKTTGSTATSLTRQQQGAQIFQAKCANCHDARLASQVMRDFPNLDDEIAVVTNGRGSALETMPSFGGVLTAAEIRDVVEYTRAQLGR